MSQETGKKSYEISALDLRFLVSEWESLKGAFIRKIYQPSTGARQPKVVKPWRDWKFLIELFIPQKGTHYLHVFPSRISLNKHKGTLPQNARKEGGKSAFGPESPSGFCMSLRKHLSGKKIEDVRQHGFDRILEISAGGLKLILEFVPPGNVILTDPEGTIIAALSTKKWKDREIRVRSKYMYPPERADPFSLAFADFKKHFQQQKKTAAILASDLGFGSEYANRLCDDAKVRPDKSAHSLTESELKGMFSKMRSLERVENPEPFVEVGDKEKERAEWIEKQRAQAMQKWRSVEASSKEKADAIYRKFDTVQAVLEKFSAKKDSGFEPIQRKDGLHITVNLDGIDVPLDMKKSAQENAAFYYDEVKKARRKIVGIQASISRHTEEKPPEARDEYPDSEQHKSWHEKFKWFQSSDAILVIAGKNAEQNELLLRNYSLADEWCFHADIQGAAFTVIKSGTQEPSEQAKKEAAQFAAVNSKAWTKGYGAVSVFSVQRKNLSKNPPTGMNLPTGSFVVYGQKMWYRNVPLRIAIGADTEGHILAGPESSVRKSCPYIVILTPGSRKATDLSRDIKSEFLKQSKPKDLPLLQKLSLDELARHVPFGYGEIAKK